jgi:single stranded DNA-binding protein (ssb)
MSSIANITVLGNLTRNPEAGQMPDGTPTSRFGIAVNSKVKKEETVTYFRVNFIGKLADVANQYLAKGRQVLVVGALHQENFTKSDGTPGNSLEIRGNVLQLIGAKPESAEPQAKAAAAGATPDLKDEDIPF